MKTRKKNIIARWLSYVLLGMLSGWVSLDGYAEENAPQDPSQEPLIPIMAGFDLDSVQLAEVSLKDIQAAWDVLYENIAKESGVIAQNKLYRDVTTLVNDFNAYKLDIVVTTALHYLRMSPEAQSNRYPDIYGAVAGGQKSYRYLLLVRTDSGVSGINELRGKTMLIQQGDETGIFYLNTLLLRNGQPESEGVFQAIRETKTFSQAVLEVFFQKGDACLTTHAAFETMIELNPQLGKQPTILERSPALTNPVLFFHKQLPQETKNLIVERLLNLQTGVYGQQFLLLYKIDGLIQFELSDLDLLRTLLQEYESYHS